MVGGRIGLPQQCNIHIQGPPGTGKCTLLRGMIKTCSHAHLQTMLLCAGGASAEACRLAKVPCASTTLDGGKWYSVCSWRFTSSQVSELFCVVCRRSVQFEKGTSGPFGNCMKRMRALAAYGYGKRRTTITSWNEDGTRPLSSNAPALWATLHEICTAYTISVRRTIFRLYMRPSAQWWTTVSDACWFGEGTVTANTIRLSFRLQPNTVTVAVTKASVQLMNNLVAETLYSARDRFGRVLSGRGHLFSCDFSQTKTCHDHAKSLQGDRYCQW